MDQVTYTLYLPLTMIALHLRDSPAHLIAPSQQTGFGIPASFGGSSFHGRAPCASLTVTLNLRDLYRVRCYSLVIVVHHNYAAVKSQHYLCTYIKNKQKVPDFWDYLLKVVCKEDIYKECSMLCFSFVSI